jgi:hypothetical protein
VNAQPEPEPIPAETLAQVARIVAIGLRRSQSKPAKN